MKNIANIDYEGIEDVAPKQEKRLRQKRHSESEEYVKLKRFLRSYNKKSINPIVAKGPDAIKAYLVRVFVDLLGVRRNRKMGWKHFVSLLDEHRDKFESMIKDLK